jgi:glycosyltransferase involved in cell wall biosynthesis
MSDRGARLGACATQDRISILYASFEALIPGTAPQVHVQGLSKAITATGQNVCTVFGGRRCRSTLAKLGGYVVATVKVVAMARRHDVVLLRYHPAQLILLWTLRLMGSLVVLEINGVPDDAAEAHPGLRHLVTGLRGGMRWSCLHADMEVVVTAELKEYVGELTGAPRNVVWASNGTDIERFEPNAPESRPGHVCFVGALARWQGLSDLLAAAASPSWPEHVCLSIAGDGPMRSLLEVSHQENVRYLGRLAPADLVNLYGMNSIAVSPKSGRSAATSRGLSPLKVAEAHAAGCALIVTDIPGQADLVRRAGSGLVVPPDDPEALALAVRELVVNEPLRYACMDAARSYAAAELSWDHTWRTIMKAMRTAG